MKDQDIRLNTLPYTFTTQWMNWLSVITAPLLIGFIFGLIALYLTDKDNRLYQSFANDYSETALMQIKRQKKFAIFSAIFSSIVLCIILYCFYEYGMANPAKIIQLQQ